MSREGGLTEAWRLLTEAVSKVGADPAVRLTVHDEPAPDWENVDQFIDNPDAEDKYDWRHVFLFPAGKAQAATASRGKDLVEYRFELVVLERYDGAEPVPPKAWVRARLDWVEVELFDRLNDARSDPYFVGGEFHPQAVEWADVYDVALLREQKLFQSVLALTLRRLGG